MLRIVLTALLVTMGSAPTAFAAPKSANKDLIVLVLVDAMRPDHMGSYGYTRGTTPNLDKLAQEGTRYTRAYANAPWTRPSTVSFLTGLNASRHRTESAKTKLPKDVTTLAQRLKAAGYKTAGFTANGNGGSLAGLEKGFDVFEDPTTTYTKDKRGVTYNGLPTGPFVIDRVLGHLKKSTADKEFLFIFLVDPHDPYGAPPELEAKFLGPDFKGTPRRKALWEIDNNYSDEEKKSMQAIYDAGIFYADQALGTFFQGLKDQGLYDNTSVFVSADHGEGFGEHGFYLHAHHFWDEVVKIPLIAKSKKLTPGVEERLTQSIDVSRTIAELAQADTKGLMGRPLTAPADATARVISEYNEFGIKRQAIIGGDHKVIWQRPADAATFDKDVKSRSYFPSVSFDQETVHVFDLKKDPAEKQNLAELIPNAAKALLDELRAFVSESGRLAQAP